MSPKFKFNFPIIYFISRLFSQEKLAIFIKTCLFIFIQVTPPTVESVRENIEAEDQADLQEAAEAYQLRLGNECLETNVDRVDYANHGNIFIDFVKKTCHIKQKRFKKLAWIEFLHLAG